MLTIYEMKIYGIIILHYFININNIFNIFDLEILH